VPHLRDSLIVAKVGFISSQGSKYLSPENPNTQRLSIPNPENKFPQKPSKTKAKSPVKPQNHSNPSIQTTYPWHFSYLKTSILETLEKTNQRPQREPPPRPSYLK
jgi:hypothetical protein